MRGVCKRQWREFEMTRSRTTPGASARGLDVQGARPPDPTTPHCLFPSGAKPGLDAAPASSLDTEQVFEVLISAPINSDEFEAALDRLFADDSATSAALTIKFLFLIVGGLYSVTALRKNNDEGVKVYTKHQDLTQASEHHKQMTMS